MITASLKPRLDGVRVARRETARKRAGRARPVAERQRPGRRRRG
ncbi:hypothetical protein PJP10_00965 [Mycobacterium kansasii]